MTIKRRRMKSRHRRATKILLRWKCGVKLRYVTFPCPVMTKMWQDLVPVRQMVIKDGVRWICIAGEGFHERNSGCAGYYGFAWEGPLRTFIRQLRRQNFSWVRVEGAKLSHSSIYATPQVERYQTWLGRQRYIASPVELRMIAEKINLQELGWVARPERGDGGRDWTTYFQDLTNEYAVRVEVSRNVGVTGITLFSPAQLQDAFLRTDTYEMRMLFEKWGVWAKGEWVDPERWAPRDVRTELVASADHE